MSTTTDREWRVNISEVAKRTCNPIRQVVDCMKVEPCASKHVISLSIGDPTVFGNFNVHPSIQESLIKQIKSCKSNGYGPSHGLLEARKAIAKKFTIPEAPLNENDVIIASGCSGALDIVFNAMFDKKHTLLIPRPGFSLYRTMAEAKGFSFREYDLIPEKNWEIDLQQLESLIDETTGAILVNNPSNPCGSVYSKEHLLDIIALCEKYRLPIIADEIYCDMVFKGNTFYPMASLTQEVPIIAVGGIAKKYLVPGWRVGWALIHSRNGSLDKLRTAMISLSQLIIGANTLVQSALPDILLNTPESFYEETILQLEQNVKLSRDILSEIPGLHVVEPQGAMYMMVGVDIKMFKDIKNDVEFTEKLMCEESVFCLLGQCFQFPNYFRIVITAPSDQLQEAYVRIREFCARHTKQ
ncbi:hypothetical protein DSO57_1036794 [Entomophthora muscae]|uniref:Uncharacterized protein n=2 Tax=Entomophthora muscae TaxID=34485 RepID=A0ACC2TA56_9FUNG|nr:hypothetical protein DSO57_1036794 [Entomophthora muscae]